MGDSIATNPFMLGFAFQHGAIPLSLEAIMKAIELNGAAIEMNKLAFSWGRLAAHDLQRVVSAARFKSSRRGAGQADARREHRLPRRVPDRLPERGLCRSATSPRSNASAPPKPRPRPARTS